MSHARSNPDIILQQIFFILMFPYTVSPSRSSFFLTCSPGQSYRLSSQLFVDRDNKGAAPGPDPLTAKNREDRCSLTPLPGAALPVTGPSSRTFRGRALREPVRSHLFLGNESGAERRRGREVSKPTAGYQPGEPIHPRYKANANRPHQLGLGGVATPQTLQIRSQE